MMERQIGRQHLIPGRLAIAVTSEWLGVTRAQARTLTASAALFLNRKYEKMSV